MNAEDRFIKTRLDLLALSALSPRARELYGRLTLYAGKKGQCFPKHASLARDLGLRSDRQVRRLLNELRKLGLINWRNGGRRANTFVVAPEFNRTFLSGLTGQECPVKSGFNRTFLSGHYIGRKDSSSKESLKRFPSPPPPPPPPGEGRSADRSADPEPKKLASQKTDDDEHAKRTRTPEQEFAARLTSRHGAGFDALLCIGFIQRRLDGISGLSFAQFLEYDSARTTGVLRNPMGYYQRLASDFVQAMLKARTATEPPAQTQAGNPAGKCAKCGGGGVLRQGGYCDCPMGRDLARVTRRGAERELKGVRTAYVLKSSA